MKKQWNFSLFCVFVVLLVVCFCPLGGRKKNGKILVHSRGSQNRAPLTLFWTSQLWSPILVQVFFFWSTFSLRLFCAPLHRFWHFSTLVPTFWANFFDKNCFPPCLKQPNLHTPPTFFCIFHFWSPLSVSLLFFQPKAIGGLFCASLSRFWLLFFWSQNLLKIYQENIHFEQPSHTNDSFWMFFQLWSPILVQVFFLLVPPWLCLFCSPLQRFWHFQLWSRIVPIFFKRKP